MMPLLALLLMLATVSGTAQADETPQSHMSVDRHGASVNADLRLALRDVDPDHRIYLTAKASGTTVILDRRVPPS